MSNFTRRNFLQSLGLVAGAALVVPAVLVGGDNPQKKNPEKGPQGVTVARSANDPITITLPACNMPGRTWVIENESEGRIVNQPAYTERVHFIDYNEGYTFTAAYDKAPNGETVKIVKG